MEIRTVGVLDAGTMGAGIAQVCAQAGCDVRLYDVSEEAARKGIARVADFLAKGVEKGKVRPAERDATLARIRPVAEVRAAAEGCDLVIEAVPEKMDLKRRLFREVAGAAPADFAASFRGRAVVAPSLRLVDVQYVGLLISDKQSGAFKLELKDIRAE